MAGIEQMQLKFDPQQDRLLLRVNSLDKQQLRFWLTRRIVKRLLPPLLEVLHKASAGEQADARTKAALFEFEQRNIREQVDFSSEFSDDASSLPLGENGLLVETISITSHQNGDVSVKLADHAKTSVTLRLNEKLLHSLFAILRQALAAADWDMPNGAANDITAASESPKNPGLMH
ncbi:MAG: hypothetical protein H6926_03165 [Chromatiales bacterium]|nr:hypothetical protein [Gammaproteobacteria bacterium]MCP5352175.1 hypothetical protein [Chromatiales bacterium]